MKKWIALGLVLMMIFACTGCAVKDLLSSVTATQAPTQAPVSDKNSEWPSWLPKITMDAEATQTPADATEMPKDVAVNKATPAPTPEATPVPTPEVTPVPTPEPEPAWVNIDVKFERFYDELQEYAVLTATGKDGAEIWKYTTERLDLTELSRIDDIGRFEDRYYYVENGALIALDVVTGEMLWKNVEFGGCAIASVVTEEGTVYACGYYGPDFFAADKNGKTLKVIDSLNQDYYWAYKLELKDKDTVCVTLEGSPQGDGEPIVFEISLKDYSYKILSDSALAIVKQPVSVTVKEGETAAITVEAVGEGVTYAWYFKNAGAENFVKTDTFTGDTYSVKMNEERSGRQIYCVVTDKNGVSVTSDTVTIKMK